MALAPPALPARPALLARLLHDLGSEVRRGGSDPREARVDLAKTLFMVSSKSGSTLEPNIFKDYFFERAKQAVGAEAPRRFVAITDPGSSLTTARE